MLSSAVGDGALTSYNLFTLDNAIIGRFAFANTCTCGVCITWSVYSVGVSPFNTRADDIPLITTLAYLTLIDQAVWLETRPKFTPYGLGIWKLFNPTDLTYIRQQQYLTSRLMSVFRAEFRAEFRVSGRAWFSETLLCSRKRRRV